MTGITHNQFLKLFLDIATNHRNINSFGTGDLWEYMANESNTLHPVTLWVFIQPNSLEGKTDKPKYSFIVMDAVDKGEENEDEVLSDTLRIAKDIVAILRQPYYEGFFTFEQNITFEPFTERFDSEMSGVQFDIIFNQPFLYDACSVNIDGLPAVNMDSIYVNTNLTVWGQIQGTVSNQTDLINYFNTLYVSFTGLAVPTNGSLGYIPNKYVIRQRATKSLTSTTNVQKLFNSSTNGAVTLPIGAYKFTAQIYLSDMNTTAGNSTFSLAGTAVTTAFLMHVIGYDNAPVTTTINQNGQAAVTASFNGNMHTASVSASQISYITGSFEVTTAGTIIPSIALTTAAAATVNIGTYFEIECLGLNTVTTVGPWS
jgi:hypothetical protein